MKFTLCQVSEKLNKKKDRSKAKWKKALATVSGEAINKVVKCFFYRKKENLKKNCTKYEKWLQKKDIIYSLMCFESNLVNIPNSTWWIVFSAYVHIANNIQGFLSKRPLTKSE